MNRAGMFEMGMPDDDQHTFKIVKVNRVDMGQLTCVASNQYGSDSCIFTLELAGKAYIPIPRSPSESVILVLSFTANQITPIASVLLKQLTVLMGSASSAASSN